MRALPYAKLGIENEFSILVSRYQILNMKQPANEIPEASLRRLPIYYRRLQDMIVAGATQAVSCADLARVLGLDPTLVRKDIEITGIVGKPRVGMGSAS